MQGYHIFENLNFYFILLFIQQEHCVTHLLHQIS